MESRVIFSESCKITASYNSLLKTIHSCHIKSYLPRWLWPIRNISHNNIASHREEEEQFVTHKFRPKSSFIPRYKNVIRYTYLSCLEERLLDIKIPSRTHNNLTKEEWNTLRNLKDDPHHKKCWQRICYVVWDREDYLKVAYLLPKILKWTHDVGVETVSWVFLQESMFSLLLEYFYFFVW